MTVEARMEFRRVDPAGRARPETFDTPPLIDEGWSIEVRMSISNGWQPWSKPSSDPRRSSAVLYEGQRVGSAISTGESITIEITDRALAEKLTDRMLVNVSIEPDRLREPVEEAAARFYANRPPGSHESFWD